MPTVAKVERKKNGTSSAYCAAGLHGWALFMKRVTYPSRDGILLYLTMLAMRKRRRLMEGNDPAVTRCSQGRSKRVC